VLEANPKPDLKRASGSVTSLICEGLSEFNLTYNDLILSLLLDRLHYLFSYAPDSVAHLTTLLA
jgi:D-alanine-D-alanine ligase